MSGQRRLLRQSGWSKSRGVPMRVLLRFIPLACGLGLGLAGIGCDLQHTNATPGGPEVVGRPTPEAPRTPEPFNNGCELPRGTGNGRNCPRESPVYMD